jgi:hypothetical protein
MQFPARLVAMAEHLHRCKCELKRLRALALEGSADVERFSARVKRRAPSKALASMQGQRAITQGEEGGCKQSCIDARPAAGPTYRGSAGA